MDHLSDCPGCLYLLWESLESLHFLTETEFAFKTPKLVVKFDTLKNFFNVFIQDGLILPLSVTPIPALRSENTSVKENFTEAMYSMRAEGIRNLFILQIRSKTDMIKFNIKISELTKETFTISFYNGQKWLESQNISPNNDKVTFSIYHDDIQKNQSIGFFIGSSTRKEVPLLELEL